MENGTCELSPYSVFDGIDEKAVARIASIGEELNVRRDEVIFHESSATSDLYIIKSGRVRVEVASVQPVQNRKSYIELAVLRKGEIFGEIAFLEGHRRSAQITAIDDACMIKINREQLFAYFSDDYQTGYLFMRNLACILSKRLEDINFVCRNLMNAGV